MYCKYCGSEVGDDDKYCWNCSKPIHEAATETYIKKNYKKKPYNSIKILSIVGFIIVIILAIRSIYGQSQVAMVYGFNEILFRGLLESLLIISLCLISILALFLVKKWLGKVYIFSIGFIILILFTSHYIGFNLTTYFFSFLSASCAIIFLILFIKILKNRNKYFEVFFIDAHIDREGEQNIKFFYLFITITYIVFAVYISYLAYWNIYLFSSFLSNLSNPSSNASNMQITLLSGLVFIVIVFFIIFSYFHTIKNRYRSVYVMNLLLSGIILGSERNIYYGVILPLVHQYYGVREVFNLIFFIVSIIWLIAVFGNDYLRKYFFRYQ